MPTKASNAMVFDFALVSKFFAKLGQTHRVILS